MKLHSNTLSSEFLDYMRDCAIKTKAPPCLIDQIDRLRSVEDLEAEVEKLGDELTTAEETIADLKDDLQALCDTCPSLVWLRKQDEPDMDFIDAIESAMAALEKHSK